MSKNILVTGPPRCGKSTVIEETVRRLKRPLTGFFTREIKERGRRRGFMIVTMAGLEGILAHDNISGQARVGKYRVNLNDLDRVAVPSMIPARPGGCGDNPVSLAPFPQPDHARCARRSS